MMASEDGKSLKREVVASPVLTVHVFSFSWRSGVCWSMGILYSCTPDSFPHFLPVSTKLILLVIFSLYKSKLVDPWVRQKRDQRVLQNNGCNGRHVTLSLSMTSQNSTN